MWKFHNRLLRHEGSIIADASAKDDQVAISSLLLLYTYLLISQVKIYSRLLDESGRSAKFMSSASASVSRVYRFNLARLTSPEHFCSLRSTWHCNQRHKYYIT